MNRIKLFFLPHAGGSAKGYMTMSKYLNTSVIEPIPLEMAGRGKRTKEKCFTEIRSCVEDLYQRIKPEIVDSSYAFFGHSLGTIVGYELIKYIEMKGDKSPVCGFFSGRVAPDYHFPGPVLSGLPNSDFIAEFNRFQGLPPEILENEKILELVLPILRADVQLAESYKVVAPNKIHCDVYAFYGEKDVLVSREGVEAWREVTDKAAVISSFPGGHFYFKNHTDLFTARINEFMEYQVTKGSFR